MPYLLATALIPIMAASSTPAAQPNISGLDQTQQAIRQMDREIRDLNLSVGNIATRPFSELSSPILPKTFSLDSSMGNLHPYGPSFRFNGVTVHIEPIAANVPATQP